ncbi:MAG: hypothetical protein HFF42_05710 [Lawsonibacter sp.]|jgi:hypothetical protein|nr:hypothetical protein [Lawsonibacter sp.]
MKFCVLMGSPWENGGAASMKALTDRAIYTGMKNCDFVQAIRMPVRRSEL